MVPAVEDRERVAALYREYGRVIYRRCLKLLRDPERARDATQDVFLKLVRNLSKFDPGRGDPLPWIYSIATYHCLDTLRDQAARRDTDALNVAWDIDPPQTSDSFAERQLASQVLARFDAKTQAVAFGMLCDGMEQQELADALGMSTRTVARRLDRFLTNARKYMNRSDS
jgi:RNA polymerase sigma-70 factor (ECF subfamily)